MSHSDAPWKVIGVAAALPLLLLALTALPPASTRAQAPPATYYGISTPGDRIEATRDGTVCAGAAAAADGFWLMTVPGGGACGLSEGATLVFARNGVATSAAETWRPGGVPSNVASGVVLDAAAVPTSAATAAPARTDAAFTGVTPPAGGSGLLVTASEVTAATLRGTLASSGCALQALAVLREGRWLVYPEGAPAAVNATFPATLASTSAFFVRC